MADLLYLEADELYARLKEAKIMLVDDEPVLMEVLQAFLEDNGYSQFITVEDSRAALGLICQERPDVLLLDLKMPHVDGFEILSAVRSSEGFAQLPVIVLTSSSDAPTKLRALELGATDFLAKPVDASELALRLRNTLTVKAYQDQLTYYDALTKLPNRKLYLDRLGWLLKTARRENQRMAILDIGLDRFKKINDSFGPAWGDVVLKEVAARLVASVRDSDVVSRTGGSELWRGLARVGGDEFSMVLPGVEPHDGAVFIASRIQDALQAGIPVAETEVFVTASVGIAVYPNDGDEADVLVRNAGAAKAYAKIERPGRSYFYSPEINERAQQRLSTEAALRHAIEQKDFVLHYQPKVDLKTGRVSGCEALIRWQTPDNELVFPDKFIGVAEDAGMIVEIGEWVIGEACRQQAAWCQQGAGDFMISVNVAGPQFRHDNLDKTIHAAARSAAMRPERLRLEITESMLMGDAENFIGRLHRLRASGPTLSIDDFGTGYSSLSYLKRFPVDELKIDRSFIVDMLQDKDDGAIVRGIIALAHSLGLTVVAEGVEEREQVEFLDSLGCEMIQGWYFSKALSADEFAAYAAQGAVAAKP